MSTVTLFYWSSEYEYCGGGKKAERPRVGGYLHVETDGSISVEPDDDYYGGSIAPDKALELAKRILDAHEAKTT